MSDRSPRPAAGRSRRRASGSRHLAIGIAAVAAVGLVGCTAVQSTSSEGTSTSSSGVRTVATGIETPWSIVFLENGTPLISERDSGRIAQLSSDGTRRTVATIREVVHTGEGGLLGLAVHDERLYAYLTTAQDNRILSFNISSDGGRIELSDRQVVLAGLPSAGNHNGGRIAFGPDGMLYATVGDAGEASRAQDRTYLGGKILRLRPDGSVPDDNPFPGSPVHSLGHRNPQGLAWDEDGTMYAAEFGQNTWDELNVVRPGANYGWPTVEGIARDGRYTDPVQQWAPSEASPSGIAVAEGRIWIANLRGQSLRVVPLTDATRSETRLTSEYGRLRDVVPGPDGDLWLLTSNTDGRGTPTGDDDRVLRLDPDA